MDENKVPASVYITLIIAALVLGIGYYVWGTSSPKTSTDAYSTTDATPTPTPVASVSTAPTFITASTTQSLKNNMHTITIETNKGTIVFE